MASVTARMRGVRTRGEVDALLGEARPWLYRLALAITADPSRAEDATQETLVRAVRSRAKLQEVDEPRAWLRRVVTRCAIDALARRDLKPLGDLTVSEDLTETVAVRETLRRLEPLDRVVLALIHFEGLSYAEAAEVLDIPLGTVGSRLFAAREAFRQEWQK